jgi:hypothetical protein
MSKTLPPVGLKDCIDVEVRLARSQAFALQWLREHNGDGTIDLNGVAFAANAAAPVMRATWNVLREHGLIEFYYTGGETRLRLTLRGQHAELIDEG